MGLLVEGQWKSDDFGTYTEGRFVRADSCFRGTVTADGSSGFSAEPGRYHLYVSPACGWSHRTQLFQRLRGLDDVVSTSKVEAYMGERGWTFSEPGTAAADPIAGRRFLHEVYTAAKPDYTGRVTVPVLWDRRTQTIVSNESLDICRAFDRAFTVRGETRLGPLFPDEGSPEESEHQAMIEANYHALNNGVYRAGFAKSQEAYEEAARAVFERLDALEPLLGQRRYLCGERITAADLFLFPTLFRFDAVYHTHFKCNLRRLVDYPNLWGYTRELYQLPGVREDCELEETKVHYYTSHPSVNPRGTIPIGPELDFEQPHGRGRLGGG
ncbi:glutathione S-transferase family protein [Paraliomyxa miuraensis]|uniref:glutathione S-transferase family protein n=1 Tax=Paraliomyxa miuraensis TaxID=376150 RepID=UPI00225582CB|nr:glutathione S-transferase C-terminal domain-containing protein [Paraliomyxa miuraensis]MCX4243478.1 glutathione S-transferase C-terminal domain-containing protein [Paraliomyxa miuraensis]